MVEEITVAEVAEQLRGGRAPFVLLDVREPWEREIAAIHPSIHIPLAEVSQRLDELPRDRPVVVYCHSGARSAMVAGFLHARGFPRVANLEGGIDAWALEIDPELQRY